MAPGAVNVSPPKPIAKEPGDPDWLVRTKPPQDVAPDPLPKPPPGMPEAPIGMCIGSPQESYCPSSLAQFRDRDWPNAWRGDYQGGRNVAFCLTTGCNGAVMQNPIQGCAWRIVVQLSGDPQVDPTDTMAFKGECGRLDAASFAAAELQAENIFPRVHKRPLPQV